MRTETKRIIKNLRPKLTKVIDAYQTACGHDGPLSEAGFKEEAMLKWLANEIDMQMDAANPP